MTNAPEDISQLNFETALAELEKIVTDLEKGQVSLEESIKSFERGEKLKRHCETLLQSADARIEKITLDAQGKPKGVEPLDFD